MHDEPRQGIYVCIYLREKAFLDKYVFVGFTKCSLSICATFYTTYTVAVYTHGKDKNKFTNICFYH